MKLKEGMYVRTKGGKIYQLTELDLQFEMTKQTTAKASNNIIDLIEVGDIITYEFPTGLGMLKYENVTVLPELLNVLKNGENNHEYTILSIVTKEQFESMSYKVN